MIRSTPRVPRSVAPVLLVLLALRPAAPVAAQTPADPAIRDLFLAYEYYEDVPATRGGIPTVVALDPLLLESVRLAMREAVAGFAMLARRDSNHWMGLERRGGLQLLRIRDATNEYNARIAVDMVSGRLTILRGVDYRPFNDAEDASITAFLAVGYLRRALAKDDVFPAVLRTPTVDLAGLVGRPSGDTAGGAAQQAGAALVASVGDSRGFLRLWSTAGVAARELFAADKFGNDAAAESGDFAQAVLAYTDEQGPRELAGKELETSILGRARPAETPLRVEELEAMIASLAARFGGVDLTILPVRTTYHVPSRPPTAQAEGSPGGSRDAAVRAFEYVQALGLLSGDYTVVPEAAMAAPGFAQQDLDLYWWARLQRASNPAALYPPLVDSGGSLSWGEFALFVTAELGRAGVPSRVVLIRRPGKSAVPYHAVCLYQVGPVWRWMDAGRIGDESAADWLSLPARIYGRDVTVRVVDVAREWLRNTIDESSGWLLSRIAP